MNIKNIVSSLVIIPLILLTSCATIVNGTTQRICFTSCPPHATIWVDHCQMGQTPIAVDLTRGNNHIVHIELDGYQPYDIHIQKRMSKWVFGNIVFGGVIGLVVDLATGGVYKLTPEQVCAHLQANGHNSMSASQGYVAVTLSPDSSWEKIGQLSLAQ